MSKPNKIHEFLGREGWVIVLRKRMGMIRIIRWSKPGTDWHNVDQRTAYRVARDSKKWQKNQTVTP